MVVERQLAFPRVGLRRRSGLAGGGRAGAERLPSCLCCGHRAAIRQAAGDTPLRLRARHGYIEVAQRCRRGIARVRCASKAAWTGCPPGLRFLPGGHHEKHRPRRSRAVGPSLASGYRELAFVRRPRWHRRCHHDCNGREGDRRARQAAPQTPSFWSRPEPLASTTSWRFVDPEPRHRHAASSGGAARSVQRLPRMNSGPRTSHQAGRWPPSPFSDTEVPGLHRLRLGPG